MTSGTTNPISEVFADIDELKLLVSTPGKTVILTHRNPDGDAIGSSMALYSFLENQSHHVTFVLPSEYPNVFERFLHGKNVLIFDLQQDEVKSAMEGADVFFALDFNSLERIDKVGEILHKLEVPKVVMIDHHLDPEPFASLIFSDPTSSSTCELLLETMLNAGYERQLDFRIAECLLLGILTDTGCFSHSVSPKLLRHTAYLLDLGVQYKPLVDEIFNSLDEKYLRLLGHCLASRFILISDLEVAYIYLSKEDYRNFQIQRGDTEGLVNYLLKLSKVKVAALITEQPTIIKFSFRSKNQISVADFARKYFKGGGHLNAAGGSMYGSIDIACKKFEESIAEFLKN